MRNLKESDLEDLKNCADLKTMVRELQKKIDFSRDIPKLLETEEIENVQNLASVGLSPNDIALSMGWGLAKRQVFIALSSVPESDVAVAIARGKMMGISDPQTKLKEAAAEGNIEAAKALADIQENNRFRNLLTAMDDDEY